MFVKSMFFKNMLVKNMIWQDHVCPCLLRPCQFDPIWSNLIQFDPIWSNMIHFDPNCYKLAISFIIVQNNNNNKVTLTTLEVYSHGQKIYINILICHFNTSQKINGRFPKSILLACFWSHLLSLFFCCFF